MRSVFAWMSVLLLCLLSSGVAADAASSGSIAERVANQKSLRVSVEAGEGKFAKLSRNDKAGLLAAQDRIFQVLEGLPSESQLTATQRATLGEAESEVARIVAKLDPPAGKPKVVCSYEARIGSNRKERVCKPVSSSDTAEARQQMQKMQTR